MTVANVRKGTYQGNWSLCVYKCDQTQICVCISDVYARQRPMCALLYDSTLGPSTNTRHYLSTHSDVVGDEGTTKLMLTVMTNMQNIFELYDDLEWKKV